MKSNTLHITLGALFCAGLTLWCAATEFPVPSTETGWERFHQTGFEKGARVVPFDASSPTSDDDVVEGEASATGQGGIKLYYEGGDSTMRRGRIMEEPGAPANHVLHFWLGQANAKNFSKARIQADLKGLKDPPVEFYHSVRFRLPKDMQSLKAYPLEIRWLTIMEVWNNAPLKPYPFRVTVGLHKGVKGEAPLHFYVDAQDIDQADPKKAKFFTIWSNEQRGFEVPFEKWMLLEYHLVEGDASHGRFAMAVTPEGEGRRMLFDITNYTHHTQDPKPDGFAAWNPIKLYTSKQLAVFMKDQGKALEAWWDDLALWVKR